MTDDNVINMPTPKHILAQRIRVAHARSERGAQEWIDGLVEEATTMVEARDTYDDDREFSIWLMDNGIMFYSPDDQAALINMGRNPDLMRVKLQETKRTSLRYIWKEEMKAAYAEAAKSDPPYRYVAIRGAQREPPPESPQSEPQEAATAEPAPAETMKSADELERRHRLETKPPPPSLKGLPKAEIVAAYLTHADTPARMARFVKTKKGRDIWMLLIESIEAGHFGEPTDRVITSPNLRMILPWIQDRTFGNMDISKPAERQQIREVLFPLLVERPELKGALQAALPSAFRDRQKSIQESARREFLVADARAKAAAAATKEASTVIIAYGTPLWPADPESVGYTLAELECACHFSRFFMTAIMQANETPKGMQLAAAHLVKYMIPIQRGFVLAVNRIFDAYVANPKGESEMPVIPKAD
jgi:hypothetical protein